MLREVERHFDLRELTQQQQLLADLGSIDFLKTVLSQSGPFGRVAAVSSFGAESAVLLHQVAAVAPQTPVIFIDTQFHFDETLAYRDELVTQLALQDVRSYSIDPLSQKRLDLAQLLHLTNADRCCHARKVDVLTRALRDFDGWISGQKRFQSSSRARINRVEWDDERNKWKFNPLADWHSDDLEAYRIEHGLPHHPLRQFGYSSVGCAPCTTPITADEDPRAGRWRGTQKLECGLHRNPNIIAASVA